MPSRRLLLASFLLLPLAAGCIDSLGLGSDCAVEMAAVRLDEGSPDDTRRDEFRGEFVERWFYTSARRTYTFRWGAGYSGCEADGPNSYHRQPGGQPSF